MSIPLHTYTMGGRGRPPRPRVEHGGCLTNRPHDDDRVELSRRFLPSAFPTTVLGITPSEAEFLPALHVVCTMYVCNNNLQQILCSCLLSCVIRIISPIFTCILQHQEDLCYQEEGRATQSRILFLRATSYLRLTSNRRSGSLITFLFWGKTTPLRPVNQPFLPISRHRLVLCSRFARDSRYNNQTMQLARRLMNRCQSPVSKDDKVPRHPRHSALLTLLLAVVNRYNGFPSAGKRVRRETI